MVFLIVYRYVENFEENIEQAEEIEYEPAEYENDAPEDGDYIFEDEEDDDDEDVDDPDFEVKPKKKVKKSKSIEEHICNVCDRTFKIEAVSTLYNKFCSFFLLIVHVAES